MTYTKQAGRTGDVRSEGRRCKSQYKNVGAIFIIALLLLSISVGFIGGVRDDMRAGNGIGNSINSIIQFEYLSIEYPQTTG